MAPRVLEAGWRESWERLTHALEQELVRPEPRINRVVSLARERQLLLRAEPVGGEEAWGAEERAATLRWLQEMLEREPEIQARAAEIHEELGHRLKVLKRAPMLRDRYDGPGPEHEPLTEHRF